MNKPGVTKMFLPSIEKARIELYFTDRSSKRFRAHYTAKSGIRIYRVGRLCIGVLSRRPEEGTHNTLSISDIEADTLMRAGQEKEGEAVVKKPTVWQRIFGRGNGGTL